MIQTTVLPVSKTAIVGLLCAILATALSVYGTTAYAGILDFKSVAAEMKTPGTTSLLTGIVALGLGATAILLARIAIANIARNRETQSGNAPAVFATFLGLFAMTLGGVISFVIYVFPRFYVS